MNRGSPDHRNGWHWQALRLASVLLVFTPYAYSQPLNDTKRLEVQGDIASQMVDGVDRFLMKQIEKAEGEREKYWKRDFSSKEAYEKSIAPNRRHFAQILGIRDARPAKIEMQFVSTTNQPAAVAKSPVFEAYAVRWSAFGDVHGEGLLLTPLGRAPIADVIAIPDADQTPEMIAGLTEGMPPGSDYARSLVESGCRVIVPVLLDRQPRKRIAPGRADGPELSNREFIYRSAYELGRHVIGYEVQKALAAVDWFTQENSGRPIGVVGFGEGGMISLYAGALDARIAAVGVSGYLGRRDEVWKEPIERNIFGLLQGFWDGDIAWMICPRGLAVEDVAGPHVVVKSKAAAPGVLTDPRDPAGVIEFSTGDAPPGWAGRHSVSGKIGDAPCGFEFIGRYMKLLAGKGAVIAARGPYPQIQGQGFDPASRQARQLHELDRHNQQLLAASADVRAEFMKKLDTSSLDKYEASVKPYRETFYNDILGRFDEPLLPMNARTRKAYDTDKFVGYEVVLDVFPDVFAYGILLLPKDLKDGERRPVVVCQHGLEGRPQDTVAGDNHFYRDFAARLAQRGFITFAPQNLYIFGDRFRVLGRKANPLGKTIWSVIIPQHQQILNFLKTLPNVDAKRIGFYGLSYGGKTAMRVPAVLSDYCLSICSGDFNEWVFKNATTTNAMSYVFSPEYEIFEWNLGPTFNYFEMAALIAPRPFMVERGHFDGVSTDEYVAFEYAKVRRLYAGQLKIPNRTAIEFFDGPHTINGKGTFDFLHQHLNWEKR